MEKWEIDKLERERMIKKPKPKSNFVGYLGFQQQDDITSQRSRTVSRSQSPRSHNHSTASLHKSKQSNGTSQITKGREFLSVNNQTQSVQSSKDKSKDSTKHNHQARVSSAIQKSSMNI